MTIKEEPRSPMSTPCESTATSDGQPPVVPEPIQQAGVDKKRKCCKYWSAHELYLVINTTKLDYPL